MNGLRRATLLALFPICLTLLLGCATVRSAGFYQSGTAALEAGDSSQAIRDLEAAARLLPEASEIRNHLGLAYELAGREEDALGAFRRAVALDCDNQPAQHNLSLAEAREARRPTLPGL